MRCKSAKSAAIALVALLSIPLGGVAAAEFDVTCRILDPLTGVAKSEFRPGDDVLLSLSLDVPPEAIEERIIVTVFARVKVIGLRMWSRLDEFDVRIPNKAHRSAIDGLDGFEEILSDNIRFEKSQTISLPNRLPRARVKIRAEAEIRGFGNDRCSEDLRIEP